MVWGLFLEGEGGGNNGGCFSARGLDTGGEGSGDLGGGVRGGPRSDRFGRS
jgi:hypothetical protein